MKTPILALAATMLATPALATTTSLQGLREGNRATMALNALESQGYVNFSNFRADGRNFAADVTKGGKSMHILVAPETGTISVQS
jgi:hypothetical protein